MFGKGGTCCYIDTVIYALIKHLLSITVLCFKWYMLDLVEKDNIKIIMYLKTDALKSVKESEKSKTNFHRENNSFIWELK